MICPPTVARQTKETTMNAIRQPTKRFLASILACAYLATLAVQPWAAHAAQLTPITTSGGSGLLITHGGPGAHGTRMHEGYQVLQTGARVPGSGATTSVLTAGSMVSLSAPRRIPGMAPGTAYIFLFWDIGGHLKTHPTATFKVPATPSSIAATAWYLPTGGGACTAPAGCPSGVTAYGFSLTNDAPLAGTPIAAVVPASTSVWAPPSATVWTTTSVTITAANPLEFVRWLAPHATATGLQLAVDAGVSTIAIAFYGVNPCQYIQDEIDAVNPGDFPGPNQALQEQIYIRYLLMQLRACEARHS
jgi:hypothetical protein